MVKRKEEAVGEPPIKKLALRVVLTNKSSSSVNTAGSNRNLGDNNTKEYSSLSEDSLQSSGEELTVISDRISSGDELEFESEEESELNVEDEGTAKGRLTQRQKSMIEAPRNIQISPGPFGRKKILTEEEQMKRLEESRKRKDIRDQKLEETKMATIQRLLQKQSSRSKKLEQKKQEKEETQPDRFVEREPGVDRYIDSNEKRVWITDARHDFSYPEPTKSKCIACGEAKTYSHPRTNAPLCTKLACYKSINQLN